MIQASEQPDKCVHQYRIAHPKIPTPQHREMFLLICMLGHRMTGHDMWGPDPKYLHTEATLLEGESDAPLELFYSHALVGQHGIWTKASLPHVKTLICVLFVRILSCSISYVAGTQTKRYMKEKSIIKEVEKRERQGNKKNRNDVSSPQTETFVKMFPVVTNRLWSHNIRKKIRYVVHIHQCWNTNVLTTHCSYRFPNTDDKVKFLKRINKV